MFSITHTKLPKQTASDGSGFEPTPPLAPQDSSSDSESPPSLIPRNGNSDSSSSFNSSDYPNSMPRLTPLRNTPQTSTTESNTSEDNKSDQQLSSYASNKPFEVEDDLSRISTQDMEECKDHDKYSPLGEGPNQHYWCMIRDGNIYMCSNAMPKNTAWKYKPSEGNVYTYVGICYFLSQGANHAWTAPLHTDANHIVLTYPPVTYPGKYARVNRDSLAIGWEEW